jgi:16S rRNA processing protein RimM
MSIPSGFVEIGKIVGAHGLRGEVRVYPSSDFPERFQQPGTRWLLRPHHPEPELIELCRGYYQPGKGLYVVQFAPVGDRAAAEALRGCLLLVPSQDRPELEEGAFLVADLIGLSVYDQRTQALIGTVSNVMTAGNDLLEVTYRDQAQPILIPFVAAIVPVVDLAQHRIEVTPPPGLIDGI